MIDSKVLIPKKEGDFLIWKDSFNGNKAAFFALLKHIYPVQ